MEICFFLVCFNHNSYLHFIFDYNYRYTCKFFIIRDLKHRNQGPLASILTQNNVQNTLYQLESMINEIDN